MKTFNIIKPLVHALARLILCLASLLPYVAHAGWSSGGGEFFEDRINPWFIQNTRTVSYCIDVDLTNFGQNTSQVRSKILKAISFWKTQFSKAPLHGYDPEYFYTKVTDRLGSQDFVEVSCFKDPDIRFQFGILTPEQRQLIDDPTKYIGISVRTSYDEVQLRAKGFIYFSPEQGPLKSKILAEYPAKKWLKDLPGTMWSGDSENNLLEALVHELGHVFGLKHSDFPFMYASSLESLILSDLSNQDISIANFPFSEKTLAKANVFSISTDVDFSSTVSCWDGKPEEYLKEGRQSRLFFHVPESDNCIGYEVHNDKFNFYSWRGSWFSPEVNLKERKLIGSAILRKFSSTRRTAPISIWLTPKQMVMPKAPYGNDNVSLYPYDFENSLMMIGEFRFANSPSKETIFVTYEQGELVRVPGLKGLMDGQSVQLLTRNIGEE